MTAPLSSIGLEVKLLLTAWLEGISHASDIVVRLEELEISGVSEDNAESLIIALGSLDISVNEDAVDETSSPSLLAILALSSELPLIIQAASSLDIDDFTRKLLPHMLAKYIEVRYPGLWSFLASTGIARTRISNFDGSALKDLFRSPAAWAENVYGWGADNVDAQSDALVLIQDRLRGFAATLMGTSSYWIDDPDGGPEIYRLPVIQEGFDIGLVDNVEDGRPPFNFEVGLSIQPDLSNKTVGLWPYLASGVASSPPAPTPGLSFEFGSEGKVEALRLELSSNGVTSEAPRARAALSAGVAYTFTNEGEPISILGLPNLAYFSASGFAIGLAVKGEAQGKVELGFDVSLDSVAVNLDMAKDGFLSSIVSSNTKIEIGQIGLGFKDGSVRFIGGSSLGVTVPVNLTLGPARFSEIGLELDVDFGTINLSTAFSAKLGPLTVTVGGIGAGFDVSAFGSDDPLRAFIPRFVPPKLIGLAVDAGVVKGGGALLFDPDKGEYAGVLDLNVSDIGITAVGLVTTPLPGRDDGFSMVLILSASFPAIQLGFGFTLNGVGGLMGIHRTMDTDVLRAGLRNRTLDSIMFPENPVENASTVIRNVGAAFPVREGQHVFGPMVDIGWGTPRIVKAELGVLLELDSPLRLAILGQMGLGLPSLEFGPRIVDINLDVLGVIDFDRKELTVDATLYDSRIAIYTLEGEMALRLRWGETPYFALSVGGLHPAFARPPELPDLKRIAVSIGSGNNPRIRAEGYLAVTPNTLQFGAALDVRARAAGFSVEGYLGFDALFEADPFAFQVNMRAGVVVKKGSRNLLSVRLNMDLSGPNSYFVKGSASFEVLWIDVNVRFSKRFGEARPVSLPQADPLAPLLAALGDARNWSGSLPDDASDLIVFADHVDRMGVFHPRASLGVRQTVLPLGVELERFGSGVPGKNRYFEIEKVEALLTTGPNRTRQRSLSLGAGQDVQENFASAQYFALTEDEKLSAPSFESMRAGKSGLSNDSYVAPELRDRGPASRVTSKAITRITEYIVSDGSRSEEFAGVISDTTLSHAAAISAKGQRPARKGPSGFTLDPVRYGIATTQNLVRVSAQGSNNIAPIPELAAPGADTHSGARRALRRHLARHPGDRGRLQIVALHETQAA